MASFWEALPLLMAAACFWNAVKTTVSAIQHHRRGIPVTAEIIDFRETSDDEGGTSYHPVFRICDGEHKGRVWRSRASVGRYWNRIGKPLSATFDPVTGIIRSRPIRISMIVEIISSSVLGVICLWLASKL